MARFQGSLRDWRRYIDEKTQAVKDRQESTTAVAEAERPAAPVVSPPEPPVQTASQDVETALAKHRAIAEEIDRTPDAPAPVSPPVSASDAEAAGMFARLPRHVQLLMRPAKGEVAQNSYKGKFSETREELIYRLLDPQLTLEETARILNVCPTTVRRYTNRGLLPQERTQGNHRRFRMSKVLEFLEAHVPTDD
ncbi:MAG TPA: helix-turn-helix domain-containing protein [Armatimonadota bacterium]|jgi:excisionase family DNA binding protein